MADVPLTDWEMYIKQIAGMILEQQTPQALLQIRTKLYELIAHCIPADVILKTLVFELLAGVDMTMQRELVKQATFYDHRLRLGNKPIFHLEAFVAKFMSLYKRYLMEMCG
jgi:replication factor C subunit 3/5